MTYHTQWLSLMDVSGPFLSVETLNDIFPQGLPAVDSYIRKRLRQAYEEWYEAIETNDSLLDKIHSEWIRMVFEEALEFDGSVFVPNDIDDGVVYTSQMHTGTFAPDFILKSSDDGKNAMLVSIQSVGTDFEKVESKDGWPAPLVERMVSLCRANDVRLGLITDGERWTLVNAPLDSTSAHISWYSRLWFQEPETFRAFVSLLGIRRFYGPSEERLESMLESSLAHGSELTNTLGEQVRRAVEVLVQSLDKADQDRNRELLRDVTPTELYEAGLTVMMRLVFVLSAEERGLLLLGVPAYDQFYAVSKLRMDLEHEADRHGAEVLERRHDAWSRLLAVFRAVYGGIEEESLRMPALGGSLFDPDRFAFLEGRPKGSDWRRTMAEPLPIDNRTVLLLLNALQVLERSTGALALSYKALDVEQIGHVYEGLLEYTVKRLDRVTLGLDGSKKAKNTNIELDALESLLTNEAKAIETLKELTQRSVKAIENGLKKEVGDDVFAKIVLACGGNMALAERIRPFAHLLRKDAWGDFIVYPAGSFAVALGDDRSKTGAHYTPKSLAEKVVITTLEPVVYIGPSEGTPREEWKLRPSSELLDLKICDPAMGSGAFLVQVCRWLSERLVEAWGMEESEGRFITAEGDTINNSGGADPMPYNMEERLMSARRLVAERCIYGVDLNPMAVELAKLSIWLVTLAKGRPFGFLDHNLRSGDSLLGIDKLESLITFRMNPDSKTERSLFAQNIESAVNEAIDLRKRLRSIPIRDIHDIEAMKRLDAEAKAKIAKIELVADAMIGEVLRVGNSVKLLETTLSSLSGEVGAYLDGDPVAGEHLHSIATNSLSIDLPEGELPRRPFHWALEFPEVLVERGGFDAIVGNPPFLGGKKISGFFGDVYRAYLAIFLGNNVAGSADLVAYFFLRLKILLKYDGIFGLIATNTIAEGDTREVGLARLTENGVIFAAFTNEPWEGHAAVVTSRVHYIKGIYNGIKILNNFMVKFISPFLSAEDDKQPSILQANENRSFIGSYVLGMGFTIPSNDACLILKEKPKYRDVLLPYINGEDLNSSPIQQPSRWVINFWDWSLERAAEYPELLKQVEELVKPERDKLKDNTDGKKYKQFWWRHGRQTINLYHAIGRGICFEKHPTDFKYPDKPMEKIIGFTLHSKYWNPVIVEIEGVFTHALGVFAYKEFSYFSIITSTFHSIWAWKNSSMMGASTMRYTPTVCFETFAFPTMLSADVKQTDFSHPLVKKLENLGEEYHTLRSQMMIELDIGLTKLYNAFHSLKEMRDDFIQLRELHRQIDETVKEAYGWNDLELGHDFHEVPYLPANDRVRYTISESARLDILRRLYKLNQERYEAEVAEGLWDKKKAKVTKVTAKKNKDDGGQGSLF